MQLQTSPAKPAAAPRGKRFGLLHFQHPENIVPEGATLLLAVSWDGQLHMMQPQEADGVSIGISSRISIRHVTAMFGSLPLLGSQSCHRPCGPVR
jgi:hypothetical protein